MKRLFYATAALRSTYHGYKTYGYKIQAASGGLETDGALPGGMDEGDEYQFVGKTTLLLKNGLRFIFEGIQPNPMSFVLVKEQGLVYLDGDGQVTLSKPQSHERSFAQR